jgi:hypothetical protein
MEEEKVKFLKWMYIVASTLFVVSFVFMAISSLFLNEAITKVAIFFSAFSFGFFLALYLVVNRFKFYR